MIEELPIDETAKKRYSEFIVALFKKFGIYDLSEKDLVFILTEEELAPFWSTCKKLHSWGIDCARQHEVTLDMYVKEAPQEVREMFEKLLATMYKRVEIFEKRQRTLLL
jgi:hypothetical protein